MFYENNTHYKLFINMWDGEQELNDKLVTFNMTWPCYIIWTTIFTDLECNQAELFAKDPF